MREFGLGFGFRHKRDVASASAIYGKTNIAACYTALAARETTPVNLVCAMHSWGEGYSSNTRGARMVDLLQTGLETALPTTGVTSVGGTTYIPASYAPGAPVQTYTALLGGFAGGVSASGFGRRDFRFTVTGHGARYVYTCTDFEVFWFCNGGTGGTMTVTIDGTPQTVVDTSSGAQGYRKVAYTGLSNASHTIEVVCTTPGTDAQIIFNGLNIFRGNYTKGIRVIDASRAASVSTSNNSGDGQLLLLSGFTMPIIALDINDYNNQIVTATWKTNITNRKAEFRTQLGATTKILLVTFNAPNNLGARTPAWSTLEQASRELVDADAHSAYLPLSGVFPTAAADGGTTLWNADLLHHTPAGAAPLANKMVLELTS